MQPLVSVIVTVYRMEEYLPRCVDSLLAQTWPNLEILLIDDGSPDACPALCDRYAAADARVRVVHTENGGVSRARNIGLREAKGDWIAFADADDWLEPECIAALCAALESGTAGIAACNHWIDPSQGEPKPRFPLKGKTRSLTAEQAFRGVLYHDVPDISPWGKLYRRAVFDGVTYPEGHIFEDTARIAPLLAAADGVTYTPQPLYHYLFREQSISKHETDERIDDFERAVQELTSYILARFPQLARGCDRRRMHAWLSMRRFYVGCSSAAKSKRNALEKRIRSHAWRALTDRDTPTRDKLGVAAVLLHAYDPFWKLYSRKRWN